MRKLYFFAKNTSTDDVTFLCIPICVVFGVSVLSEPDNKSRRSPCFMIKGLCSLAAVCPQKREKNTARRGREKNKQTRFICHSQNSIFCYFPQIRLIRKVL